MLINEFSQYWDEAIGMDAVQQSEGVGRRDRNMRQKRERIFRAAAELIAERGFEAVTTQEISERADVAAGTLFRYAASKRELLLMVYNEEFRAAIEAGEAQVAADPVDAILGIVAPTLQRALDDPENSAAYQRELLFGPAAERYRSEGLALVLRLETAITERLTEIAAEQGLAEDDARLAGGTVFGALLLAIARIAAGARSGHDATADLRRQIQQIVAGTLVTPPRRDTGIADPPGPRTTKVRK